MTSTAKAGISLTAMRNMPAPMPCTWACPVRKVLRQSRCANLASALVEMAATGLSLVTPAPVASRCPKGSEIGLLPMVCVALCRGRPQGSMVAPETRRHIGIDLDVVLEPTMRSLDTSARAHPAHLLAVPALREGGHRTFAIAWRHLHAGAWPRHARYHLWKIATAVVLAFGGWAG